MNHGEQGQKDYDSVDLLLQENKYSDYQICTIACADALLNHKDTVKSTDECISLAKETAMPRTIPKAIF